MPTTPKPGGQPSVTAVIKFLKAAGFQHSRYSESSSRSGGSGAKVRVHSSGTVSVQWNEGDADFVHRMITLGITDAAKMPQHPKAARHAREYAEALAPRYNVQIHGDTIVYVTARDTLPARPKGVPTATTVRKALAADGITQDKPSWHITAVDQPDHTRVAVKDSDTLKAVRAALDAQGWIYDEHDTLEHHALRITGSAADRPARLRKLRAERAAKAELLAEGREVIAQADAEEQPKREEALQQAQEEAQQAFDAAYPAEAVSTPQPPAEIRYAPDGRAWRTGQRATFKTADGFLMTGGITGFGNRRGEQVAYILVDTRQVAPAARPAYKGAPNLPGKPRSVTPAVGWTRPLDKLLPATAARGA